MSLRFSLQNIDIDNTDCFDCKGRLGFPDLQKELKFLHPIYGIVEFEKVYVIRIYPGSDDLYNQNVFGISKERGEIIWQIAAVMRPDVDSPYTAIWKKSDKVVLGNWSGMDYTVDPETGEILTSLFTK